MNNCIVRLQNVSLRYPRQDGGMHTVLRNISINLEEGEFLSLLGASGCGKSSLLGMVGGYQRPTEGTVQFDGRLVEEPHRERGMVFQKYSNFPFLTALENVAFGLDLEGLTIPERILGKFFGLYKKQRSAYYDQARELLLRVGLKETDFGKYPKQLSGGMQQRVAIAQALAMKPKALLMDEPFSGLDMTTKKLLHVLLLEIWEEHKMTIIFVGHDRAEAAYLSTRMIILSPHCIEEGPPQEGSTIVWDSRTPGNKLVMSTKHRFTPEFNEFLDQIELVGVKPQHRRIVEEFNKTHPHSIKAVQ